MQVDLSPLIQMLSSLGGPWGLIAAGVLIYFFKRKAPVPTPFPPAPAIPAQPAPVLPELLDLLSQLRDRLRNVFPNLPRLTGDVATDASALVSQHADLVSKIEKRKQDLAAELQLLTVAK